jgi:hypothetical protein
LISPYILQILKKDNIAELRKSARPNSGMLLRVVPQMSKKIFNNAIVDFFLEGKLTIFDATGNTIIKNREMGYHDNSRSLNFVWNGKNSNTRTCGAGPYLALFKVARFKGPGLTKMEETSLKLTILIK